MPISYLGSQAELNEQFRQKEYLGTWWRSISTCLELVDVKGYLEN
jgi:hypothetical protein